MNKGLDCDKRYVLFDIRINLLVLLIIYVCIFWFINNFNVVL